AVFEFVQHRSPCGFAHLQFHRFAAGDLDALAMDLDRTAGGGARARGARYRARRLHGPVGVVAVAVGVAPGDVAVAAHDDRWQPRQGDALDVDLAAGRGRVGPAQAGPEPDVGHAQAQVHVI